VAEAAGVISRRTQSRIACLTCPRLKSAVLATAENLTTIAYSEEIELTDHKGEVSPFLISILYHLRDPCKVVELKLQPYLGDQMIWLREIAATLAAYGQDVAVLTPTKKWVKGRFAQPYCRTSIPLCQKEASVNGKGTSLRSQFQIAQTHFYLDDNPRPFASNEVFVLFLLPGAGRINVGEGSITQRQFSAGLWRNKDGQ